MLVLSRRPAERIFIGPDITVTVIGWDGRKARIGIEAPKEVRVMREELVEREKWKTDAAQG